MTARPAGAAEPRPAAGAVIVDLLSLAGVLGALVVANREWIFNGFRWVDTWMYVGFFQHYDFAPMLADNKKIARLPWILLGYIVNKATSPVAAQYILHLGMLAAGAAALYLVLARQFGRCIAFVTAAFYLTYVPGHASGGWDYNNTPSALLYVLTYAALVRLADRIEQPRRPAIVAGVAGALLLHTNLLFILVAPALVLLVAVRIRERLGGPELRRWTRQVLLAALGGGFCLTLLLAIVNAVVGRDFIFFEKLIGRAALMMIEPDREKVWWRPWSDPWWHDSHDLPLNGYHMPLLLLVLLLTAATLLFCALSGAKLGRAARQNIAVFGVSLAIFAILQTIGHPLLQPYYMAFPLLMPTFFAFAGLLDGLFAPVRSLRGLAWNGAASLCAAVVFAGLFITLSANPHAWHLGFLKGYDDLLAIVPLAGSFLVAWLATRLPRQLPAVTVAAVGLLTIAMAFMNGTWPSDPAYREAYSYNLVCTPREAAFRLVMEADRYLFTRVKAGNSVPLVYRSSEIVRLGGCEVPLAEVARPLASMGYDVLMPYWKMEALPRLPDEVVDEAAHRRTMIAVVTRDDAYRDSVLTRLRKREPGWRIEGEMPLGGATTGAKISILSHLPASKPG